MDCNRHLKFGALINKARELGFDYLATGHYARVGYDFSHDRYWLRRGVDDSRGYPFDGWIAEVRLYRRMLGEAEIKALSEGK